MNRKIGIFDSGLGGLSILKELMKILPNEDYIYYGDSINNPYGEKSEEELFAITSNIVEYLIKENCKLIVVACNTATTSCIKKLREKYKDIIFVGTVPAIKVAYDNNYKNVVVLSTNYTMKSKRVEELIYNYKNDDQEIINISGENLANLIELDEKEQISKLLNDLLSKYKDKADAVVLGCTHYSLIKEEIKKVLPNAIILDGNIGVSREVKRILEDKNLLNSNGGNIIIQNNKNDALVSRSYEILENFNEGNVKRKI